MQTIRSCISLTKIRFCNSNYINSYFVYLTLFLLVRIMWYLGCWSHVVSLSLWPTDYDSVNLVAYWLLLIYDSFNWASIPLFMDGSMKHWQCAPHHHHVALQIKWRIPSHRLHYLTRKNYQLPRPTNGSYVFINKQLTNMGVIYTPKKQQIRKPPPCQGSMLWKRAKEHRHRGVNLFSWGCMQLA